MAYEARDCYQERTLAENSLVRNSKDLKGPQTDFSRVAKEVKCYFR